MGSVILLSSTNHLGCVGTAAYAEDLVAAFLEIRTTFGGQFRTLHGFSINAEPLTDQLTIRSMMEIEAWLSSTDQSSNLYLQSSSHQTEQTQVTWPLR